nr:hypothetical protein [Tanacetum cinerariifolium]
MADVKVNAPSKQALAMAPPTRNDDQILPRSRWVPVGKSNCYLDVEKSQSNPIYKIDIDILKHTNFFRAFTASSTILSIYIQQFWDVIRYDRDTARYICQLDKQWFDLTKDTIRDALQITPVNNNNPFSSPPTPDALINFVNNLGYPKVVKTLSAVRMWEEFTQSIHSLVEDKKNLALHTQGKKKANPIMIPRNKWEVFGMPISNELITADIQGEQYYKEYLEKVAKHQRYLADKEGSDPDSPAPKPAKATKKSKPSAPKVTPVTKPSAAQQPTPKPAPAKSPSLVDEFVDEEADMQRAVEESLRSVHDAHWGPLPPVVIREPDSRKFQPLLEVQGKGKKKEVPPVVKVGAQNEGQAGPYPGVLTEGKARSNPGDNVEPQPQSSHVVHAGPNLKHMDLEAIDVSTQLHPEQIDEGFTVTTYRNIQENLKPMVKEHVILEEPTSSTGTLSSLQHIAKDFSFGYLFFNDKPSEAENEKTTAETKAESMVSVTIQQDTSIIPPMTTPIIDLTSRPNSPNVHRPLQATATKTTTTTTTTTHPPPPQPQQSTIDSILIKCISELEQIMANLIQDNKHLEERLDSHGSRLYTLENLNIPQQVSKAVDEIATDAVDWAIQAPLQNRFRDLPEADMKEILHHRMWETNSYKAHEDHMITKKKKKRHDSPKTPPGSAPHQPPPPSPPASPSGTLGSPRASGSSQLPPPPLPPSTSPSDQPSVSSILKNLHMDDDMDLDEQAHSSDDEDIMNAYISKVNLQQDWWKPLEEHSPATSKPACKPLPLGGPPGQVIIQSDFFFNKDLEYLRYDSKGGRPGLSISKMKAAYYYPDVGLEQMVPDQMCIEEECKHEIDAIAVQTHMRILSVVKIEVFSMYGYDYMKKIVLRRTDIIEHIIAKRDFKYLYPSDFEDLYLLNLQGHLNHLTPKDMKILTTAVNLWTRHLVIKQRVKDFHLGIESYRTQLNLTKP